MFDMQSELSAGLQLGESKKRTDLVSKEANIYSLQRCLVDIQRPAKRT